MGRKGNRLSNRPAAAPTQRKGRVGLPPWRTDCHSQCAHWLRNDTSFSCHSEETVEAPPVADEARRFRGSVPVFTPQRGWKPVDTTVKAFCCCWQKVCRRRQKTLCEKETRRRQKKKSYWEHKPSETRSLCKSAIGRKSPVGDKNKNQPPEAKSPQKNRRVILTRLFLTSSLS